MVADISQIFYVPHFGPAKSGYSKGNISDFL